MTSKPKRAMQVPVGVLLSGGIDSSLVTAIAAKVKTGSEKIKSFSIYFEEASYDESHYIKKMVSKLFYKMNVICDTLYEID